MGCSGHPDSTTYGETQVVTSVDAAPPMDAAPSASTCDTATAACDSDPECPLFRQCFAQCLDIRAQSGASGDQTDHCRGMCGLFPSANGNPIDTVIDLCF